MKNFRKFIVIVLMALVTVSLVACSQKKSALEDVKVTFKGYDGHGYMEGDSKKITSNMIDIMAKKAKLDDYLTEKLKDVVETDAADYDLEKDATSDERDSLVKVERWMKEIKIRSSKKENLKNGDKVRITIKTGDKDNPVKEETKTYTVKGLKKTKKVSAKDIAKNLDVQAYGYNGKGLIAITSKKYKGSVSFHIKNNGSLKNGDKVTIKLPSEFTSDEKIDFQGKKEFTYTVQGLKELAATKDLDEIKKVTDSMVNDEYPYDEFDKYVNTFINMYFVPTSAYSDYSDEKDTSVELNDKSGLEASRKDKITIAVLYTVKDDYDEDDEADDSNTKVVEVTVGNVSIEGDHTNIDSIDTEDDGTVSTQDSSLEVLQHNLAANGIKVK
jgi:predicted DNA-binding antitoxin AbrB/MazE fold protein